MTPSVGRIIHVSRTSEPEYRTPATERVEDKAECRPAIIYEVGPVSLGVNVFWRRGAYAAWAQTWHDPRECPNAPAQTDT